MSLLLPPPILIPIVFLTHAASWIRHGIIGFPAPCGEEERRSALPKGALHSFSPHFTNGLEVADSHRPRIPSHGL
jgi:hypothetical protein